MRARSMNFTLDEFRKIGYPKTQLMRKEGNGSESQTGMWVKTEKGCFRC